MFHIYIEYNDCLYNLKNKIKILHIIYFMFHIFIERYITYIKNFHKLCEI